MEIPDDVKKELQERNDINTILTIINQILAIHNNIMVKNDEIIKKLIEKN